MINASSNKIMFAFLDWAFDMIKHIFSGDFDPDRIVSYQIIDREFRNVLHPSRERKKSRELEQQVRNTYGAGEY